MSYDENVWRAYVVSYDIEVPQERLEEELRLVRADMKHRMIYANMAGEESHVFPDAELAEQEEAIAQAALFEAKEALVLQDLSEKLALEVSQEELVAYAEEMAKRENTSLDSLKRFFGDDLAFLERDVLENKIREWACAQ